MQEPDLILMDIMLEGEMTGINAAMEVRKFSQIPIIFMSALTDNITLEAINSCPYCFKINKPFQEELLLKQLSEILSASDI